MDNSVSLQNEPPIQLHPDVSKEETTVFINENFRKISDAVNTYISNNTFNIVGSGTASIQLPNPLTNWQTYTTTVSHNLGYVPAYLVYLSDPSSVTIAIPFTPVDALGNIAYNTYAYVDSTQIVFNWNGKTFYNGQTFSYKYYFLKETAA